MTIGRKIRVSFADDLESNRSNRIQISSDSSSTATTFIQSKSQVSSGSFNDILLKRYNIAKSQFTTPQSNPIHTLKNSINENDDNFTIDTIGEHPDYQPSCEVYKEIDTELAYISEIQPLNELIPDLITKTEREKTEIEKSIEECDKYLDNVQHTMDKLDQDIKTSTDKLTFLFYLDYTLADIVSLMDSINGELNRLNQMKKNIIGKLSKTGDHNSQLTEFVDNVAKLKNKISAKYSNANACSQLVEFHNRYPKDYARSGLDGHVVTILLFYAQFEILLWDPLLILPNLPDSNNSSHSNHIDTNIDPTHFAWYQVASKFNSSDSFIRIITRKVYSDAVIDLLKIWEWSDFANADRLMITLKPINDDPKIINIIEMLINKLGKIKTPEAMIALNAIKDSKLIKTM